MRIMMLSWEYPPRVIGGLAHHVAELSRALAREGNQVEVITALGEGLPEQEISEGVTVHRVKPYHGQPLNFFSWMQQLNFAMMEKGAALCRQDKFDLVHAHDWLVAYAGRGLKHIYHLPLMATIHATEYGRNNGLHNREQFYISEVEWWLTYEAWKVICCSQFMREELEQIFLLPGDKIEVIVNGIRPEAFQVEAADQAFRERYAASGEKLIFFIGRLVREKGVQVLLEALPAIREQVPGVRLVIAGRGPYEQELYHLTSRLGLEGSVHFAGYIDEESRNQLYASADVAVFPSLYEPFGLVALEAMATGAPVVVGNCGGFIETVQHGVNGLWAECGQADDLSRQVCRILLNYEYGRQLSGRALTDIREKFSWEAVARKTEEVYQAVVFSTEARRWRAEPDRPGLPEQAVPGASVETPPGRYTSYAEFARR
ncbi:MAG TPA: glycosyltransferase family 4 protein [Firmicutes bacterium]|nr:glycosyltransferase family 4 protein [Bacillota bacterium]